MSKKRTTGYVDVGTIVLAKDKDDQGRPQYYIQFDKEVDITINGVKYEKTASVKNMLTKFDQMISRTEDEERVEKYEQTRARFDTEGDLSFIKFQISAKLG